MRIAFNNWHDAREAIGQIEVTPPGALYLLQEGSREDTHHYPGSTRSTWTGGTGRWVISDVRTGERVAVTCGTETMLQRIAPCPAST